MRPIRARTRDPHVEMIVMAAGVARLHQHTARPLTNQVRRFHPQRVVEQHVAQRRRHEDPLHNHRWMTQQVVHKRPVAGRIETQPPTVGPCRKPLVVKVHHVGDRDRLAAIIVRIKRDIRIPPRVVADTLRDIPATGP